MAVVLVVSDDETDPGDPRRGVLVDSDETDPDSAGSMNDLPDAVTPGQHRGRAWRRISTESLVDSLDMPASTRKRLRTSIFNDLTVREDNAKSTAALQGAWDRHQLHIGNTVTPGEAYGCHPNQWLPPQVIRMALEALGQSSSVAVREDTHNVNVAVECVAWAATEKMTGMVNALHASPPRDWLYVERAFDATPIEAELGESMDGLHEVAKFRFRDADGNWTLIPLAEARQHKLRCKRGVLQLFAQTLRFAWEEQGTLTDRRCPPGAAVWREEKVCLRPVFLQSAGASNEFEALEALLSLERILGTTAMCKWVVLALIADNASSNVRLKMHTLYKIIQHNLTSGHRGKVLLIDIICNGHTMMRMIIKTFSLSQLIPRCYSLNFTMRFPGRYNRLVCLIRSKAERDLLSGGYVAHAGWTDQHQAWGQRLDAVLILTVLRSLRTRGRYGEQASTARNENMLVSIYNVLKQVLTSDTSSHSIGHLCRACCVNPRETAYKISDALVSAFVELIAGKAPSTSKFYTLAETKTAVCGLFSIHRLGSRLIPSAVGIVEDNDGVVEGDDIAEFRARCNRHARQAKAAAEDEEFEFDVLLSTWGGEALETLSNQLQHGEAVSQCWLDMTYKDGLVRQAELEMFRRCTSSPDTSLPLRTIIDIYSAGRDVDPVDLELRGYAVSLELAAQLENRLRSVLGQPPFLFIQLRDHRNREKDALRRKLRRRPMCCNDPGFGREVLEQDALDDAVLDEIANGVLQAVQKLAPGTNFGLEQLLSRMRAACHPGANRRPRADRVLACGTLTQFLRRHLDAGLPDPRGRERRKDLLRAGVKLNARPRETDGTRRWHILFSNIKVAEARHGPDALSSLQATRIRTQAIADWAHLPAAGKAAFRASHTADGQPDSDSDNADHEDAIAGERMTPWQRQLGTTRWPVNPHHIQHLLDSATGRVADSQLAQRPGVCRRFGCIQHAVRQRGLVLERGGIPDAELVVPAACFQVHPGLCVTIDHAIYNVSLEIAKCIEKHFSKDLTGAWYIFHSFAADGEIVFYEYLHFSHTRRRGRAVPTTHMFCLGHMHERTRTLGLTCRDGEPQSFEWRNPWEIAKKVSVYHCTRLAAARVRLEHRRSVDGRFEVAGDHDPLGIADDVEVWPSPPVKAKPPIDPDCMDVDRIAKREARKPAGKKPMGIRFVLPGADPRHPHILYSSSASSGSSEAGTAARSSGDAGSGVGSGDESSHGGGGGSGSGGGGDPPSPRHLDGVDVDSDGPAPPVPPPPRVGRGDRMTPFGRFSLSRYCPGGELKGIGGNCNQHRNPEFPSRYCKCLLTFNPRGKPAITEEQAIRGVKRWLIYGADLAEDEQTDHKAISPYDCAMLPYDPDEDLDELVRVLAPPR